MACKKGDSRDQSGLLLSGVDVSLAKQDACMGILDGARPSGFREPLQIKSFQDYSIII